MNPLTGLSPADERWWPEFRHRWMDSVQVRLLDRLGVSFLDRDLTVWSHCTEQDRHGRQILHRHLNVRAEITAPGTDHRSLVERTDRSLTGVVVSSGYITGHVGQVLDGHDLHVCALDAPVNPIPGPYGPEAIVCIRLTAPANDHQGETRS